MYKEQSHLPPPKHSAAINPALFTKLLPAVPEAEKVNNGGVVPPPAFASAPMPASQGSESASQRYAFVLIELEWFSKPSASTTDSVGKIELYRLFQPPFLCISSSIHTQMFMHLKHIKQVFSCFLFPLVVVTSLIKK